MQVFVLVQSPIITRSINSSCSASPFVLPLSNLQHVSSLKTLIHFIVTSAARYLGSQNFWLTSLAGTHPQCQHGLSLWLNMVEASSTSTLSCSPLLWHLVLPHPLLYLLQVLGSYGYTADLEKGIASLPVNDHGVDISYAMAPHHLGTQYIHLSVKFFVLRRISWWLPQGSDPSSSLSLMLSPVVSHLSAIQRLYSYSH